MDDQFQEQCDEQDAEMAAQLGTAFIAVVGFLLDCLPPFVGCAAAIWLFT